MGKLDHYMQSGAGQSPHTLFGSTHYSSGVNKQLNLSRLSQSNQSNNSKHSFGLFNVATNEAISEEASSEMAESDDQDFNPFQVANKKDGAADQVQPETR